MELKLNVYKNGSVVKTYTTNDFILTTGVCEDILNVIDIDKLTSLGNEEKMSLEIFKVVQKSFPTFKPFLQDLFIGLTDDEFRQTAIKDVAKIVFVIVKYTISELSSIGATKN